MTSHETPEPKHSVYDVCDPHYLRQLREEAGMDVVVLARTACLSVAQVRQLETDDSDNLFYSDAIKRQAYKRLLMILGAEPPTVEVPDELRDAGKVAEAHLNTLDQIVSMSHQPALDRTTSDVMGTFWQAIKERKQVLGALVLLVAAVVLFVSHGPQSLSETVAAMTPSTPTPTSVSPEIAIKSVVTIDPPALVVSVASTPVAVASVPVAVPAVAPVASSAAATHKEAACAYMNGAMPEVTSLFAQKEGRYVYFVSPVSMDVCVVDGNKQATLLQLKAGDNRSVYGVAPWQLSGSNLQKVQIYFQGGRVSLPDNASQKFKLLEVPVAR